MNTSRLKSLPQSIILQIFTYLRAIEMQECQGICREVQHLIESENLWRRYVQKVYETDVHLANANWKRLAIYYRDFLPKRNRINQLILSVLGCSSEDRSDESPNNTLEDSLCFERLDEYDGDPSTMQFQAMLPTFLGIFEMNQQMTVGNSAQVVCGCALGRSCYWSSAPSLSPDADEYIDYRLAPRCIVRGFSVMPYRAFWHPEAPCYGPRAAQIAIGFNHGDEFRSFYDSTAFPMKNAMVLQTFVLESPVICQNAILRVTFIGKPQEQTLQVANRSEFYVCISSVKIFGQVLEETDLNVQ